MTDDRPGGRAEDRPDDRPQDRPLSDEEIEAILAELEAEGEDEAAAALRNTRGESIGAAIGSFMAGLEQQIFQRRPPAVEVVRDAQPVRMVSGEGLEITISLPEPEPEPGTPDAER